MTPFIAASTESVKTTFFQDPKHIPILIKIDYDNRLELISQYINYWIFQDLQIFESFFFTFKVLVKDTGS